MEQNLSTPRLSEAGEFLTLQRTLEREMEQIQQSTELHITFKDGRNLLTVCEPDPELREVIVEYYRSRIEQMQRWQGEEGQATYCGPMQSFEGIDPAIQGFQ